MVDRSIVERRKHSPLLFLPDKAANRSHHPPTVPSVISAPAWTSVNTHPHFWKTDSGTELRGLNSDFRTSGLHRQPRWAAWALCVMAKAPLQCLQRQLCRVQLLGPSRSAGSVPLHALFALFLRLQVLCRAALSTGTLRDVPNTHLQEPRN